MTVCFASTMAIAPAAIQSERNSVSANPFTEDSELPLDLSLGELDGSWRQFRIAGQYEFADLMQTWFSLFGITNVYGNTYFTQGETTEMGGKEYLVAYRFPLAPQELDLEDMFAVFDSGQQCDDMSRLEAAILNENTKVSLALLNPNTIGSLNDIQTLDVPGMLQASQEQFAMMQETCAEVNAENQVIEALDNLGAINRAQQDFWLENKRFTDNIESLQIGLSPETDAYSYTMTLQNPSLVTSQAIAKSPEGYHIVGATHVYDDFDSEFPSTITILCEKSEPGGPVPSLPFFDEATNYLACPLGTFETY
ncbi:type IV pilin-like G/H family protein [[Limnothrix rosea] IAM M-220]|uniref:type IV pilin-like G/H family protein n=1 Tax=[Limnothrix rosea] IAM M-220 TaxID=454133 RepID=UPI0015C5405A|nr:type IV pilin-like G/H family protein [[Limnothrix rosea] IAM M-220]